jgi:hypothetical protein
MEEHREFGMAFSSARIVTQESTPENISEIPETLFDQKSLNQGKMLRKMFFELNFLCHPSILIRRELYRPEHPYNYALRQCPDFEMYIFLLKTTPAFIMKDKLVNLRIMNDSSNASSVSYTNLCRSETEVMLILSSFFDNMSEEIFEEGFGDLCFIRGEKTPLEIECEQALMYLKVDSVFKKAYRLVGMQKLFNLLTNERSRKVLEEKFRFTYRDFFELTGNEGLTIAADKLQNNFSIPPNGQIKEESDNVAELYSTVELNRLLLYKMKFKLKKIPWLYKLAKRL